MNSSRPLHVCLVYRDFPPHRAGGGGATYHAFLAKGLLQAGHKVTALAESPTGEPFDEPSEGVRVLRGVRPKPFPGYYRLANAFGRGLPATYAATSRMFLDMLLEVHREDPIDIIETPDGEGSCLAFQSLTRRPFPVVVRLHGPISLFLRENDLGKDTAEIRAILRREREAIAKADLVTSPTEAMRARVAKDFGLPLTDAVVIPNLIDLSSIAPCKPSDVPSLLFVGRLEWRKGPHLLLDALEFLPEEVARDLKVTFVGGDRPLPAAMGGGSTKEYLLTRARTLGLADRLAFTGPLSGDGIVALRQEGVICVIPSLWENFPYTVLEAMASGNGIVAARTSGIPEMISHGEEGLFFENGNSQDLAHKLTQVLQDPDLRGKLGATARLKVKNSFSLEALIPQMEALYRATIARFQP